jgi:hypothetical protein
MLYKYFNILYSLSVINLNLLISDKKMFRIHFISLFLLFLVNTFHSQVANNSLVILSENGKRFILYVNGEKINNEPQADVKAFHVSEGWCKLKVEFEKTAITFSDSIHIKNIEKNNNKEITYSIKEYAGKPDKFRFVSIGEPSGPETPRVPEAPVDKGPVIDNTIYGNLYKANANKPVFYRNYIDSSKTCSVDLTDTDIKHAINLVTKSNDIQNKFNYVEETVTRNCYTTSQLMQLLNLLDVEMDKLKLVKRGYTHLKDKANAPKIEEVFKFKSMKENFELFLKETANAEHQNSLHCTVAITNEALQEIISAIKKTQYENDRIKVAKDKVVNNCLNTMQVQQLLEIFTHDREKMDLAKNAYAVTIDKDNYKILVDNFQFSENKKEFLQFISN